MPTNRDLASGVLSRIAESGGKLRVKSALNPMLWLCAAAISAVFLYAIIRGEVPSWMIGLLFLVVGVTLLGFIYLLFADPDKLQSEEYQLRKREIELMEQKGDPGPQIIESIELIDEPEVELIDAPEAIEPGEK